MDLPPGDGVRILTEAEAYEQAAREIARTSGRSEEDVRENLYYQRDVIELIEGLSPRTLTTTYASAVFGATDAEPSAVLYFKGPVPDEVIAARDESGLQEISLRGGMRFSLEEQIARQGLIHDTLVGMGFTELVSGLDVSSQTVKIDVALQDGRPDLRGEHLVDELISRARDAQGVKHTQISQADIAIREYPPGTRLTGLHHGYGGAGARESSKRICTTGFSVRRVSDGTDGVLTAAHCEGINRVEQNNTAGGVDLTFSAPFVHEHIGTFGDVEWHSTTSHNDYPQFWSDHFSRITVKSRILNTSVSVNADVCHFGRVTGPSCGKVSDVNSISTFTWGGCGCPKTSYNMVDVSGAKSDFGDSGGPWFMGSKGWGIHQGTRPSNNHKVFSKIQNAENAFGTAIKKG